MTDSTLRLIPRSTTTASRGRMRLATGTMAALAAAILLAPLGGCANETGEGRDDSADAVVQSLYTETTTQIANTATRKCMDVPSGTREAGAPVNQYRCHGGLAQRFVLRDVPGVGFRIVNESSGLCVAPLGYAGLATYSMRLVQARCGSAPDVFRLHNEQRLSSTQSQAAIRWAYDSAFCIDVPGGSTTDSLNLQAYRCHGGANQRFELTQP